MTIHYLRTSNNGGCGKCSCHCHSPRIDIPRGHIRTCKFADPNYTPPDFVAEASAVLAKAARRARRSA